MVGFRRLFTVETVIQGAVVACVSLAPSHAVLATSPPNDDFTSPTEISGASGFTGVETRDATKEPGEPNHAGNSGGRSVWYRWVAPSTGRWTFLTGDADYNSLLAVYTGSTVATLTPIASNDDANLGIPLSRVAFDAVQGTMYRIAVDAFDNVEGRWDLYWGPTPENDDFANAAVLDPQEAGTLSGDNGLATHQTAEPSHAGTPGGASVWYRWIAPDSGRWTLDTGGSYRGNGIRRLVAVYTGGNLGMLAPIASNNEFPEGPTSFAFPAIMGQTYRIAVDGLFSFFGAYNVGAGPIVISWVRTPSNDDFAAAEPIHLTQGSVSGTNVGATREVGEPQPLGGFSHSVWYKWQAPIAGCMNFNTLGSGVRDTGLVAYDAGALSPSLQDLRVLDANDEIDVVINHWSAVVFPTVAGDTYYLQVAGYDGPNGPYTGSIQLNWAAAGSGPPTTTEPPRSCCQRRWRGSGLEIPTLALRESATNQMRG